MSWLSDRKIKYRYQMEDGSIRHVELPANFDPAATMTFEDDLVGKYAGFEPEKLEQVHSVEYDQNGRKAVRVRQGDGSIRHISKTKLHYMKTGRIEHQYTESYTKELQKNQQEQMLRTEHNKKRAKVSAAKRKEAFQNLPDGEYTSDGKPFTPKRGNT